MARKVRLELEKLTVKRLLELARERGLKLSKKSRSKKVLLIKALVGPEKEKPLQPKVKVKVKVKVKKKRTTTKKSVGKGAKGQQVDKSRSDGLGVAAYWAALFDANEKAWKAMELAKVLTNVQITAAMNEAFPGRNSGIFEQVNRVRNRYNRGVLLSNGRLPYGKKSHRYIRDETGDVCRATASGKRI